MTTVYADTPSPEQEEAPSTEENSTPSPEQQVDEQVVSQTDESTEDAEDEEDEGQGSSDPQATLNGALDKRQKAQRGEDVSFSTNEYRALQEHDRAEDNRNRDYQRVEQQRQQHLQQLDKAHDGAMLYMQRVAQDFVREIAGGVQLTPSQQTALQAKIKPAIDTLRNISDEAGRAPILEQRRGRVKDTLRDSGVQLNASQERGLAQMDMDSLDDTIYQLGRYHGVTEGQSQAAGKDKVLVDKKDYERWSKGDRTAERAEQGDKTPPSRSGRKAGGSGSITKSAIQNASLEQIADWLSNPDTEAQVNKAIGG